MAIRAMIFIDGCWLFKCRQGLFDLFNEQGFEINYKRFPDIIAQAMAESLGLSVDVVRTCYFSTMPVNKSGYNAAKQATFYDFLADQCGYDLNISDVDFKKEVDVSLEDKWVNADLASQMTYYATIPGAYDVAVLAAGTPDYIPVCRTLRTLGKRVQLVALHSRKGTRPVTSTSLLTATRCFDFQHIYIDDYAQEIRLQRQPTTRTCMICGKEEETTWAGEEFFCNDCRAKRGKKVRTCNSCGKEEETNWDKEFFYCAECRAKHRESGSSDPADTAEVE